MNLVVGLWSFVVRRRSAVIRRWLPLLAWMAIIFFVSHQPGDAPTLAGIWEVIVKKSAHFIEYAILAYLAQRALPGWRWALLLACLYALTDEWHQSFIPGRTSREWDVVIDWAGAVTALALVHWRQVRWGQKARVGSPLSPDA